MVLNGGHSGKEIAEGRGNPIITLGKLLSVLEKEGNIYLNSIEGGASPNSIPRDAKCVITIENELDADELAKLLDKLNNSLRIKYHNDNILVEIEKVDNPDLALDSEATSNVIRYLDLADLLQREMLKTMQPTGQIIRQAPAFSSNLSQVWTEDNGTVCLRRSTRSNTVPAILKVFLEDLTKREEQLGFVTVDGLDLPGYSQDRKSEFSKYLISNYKETLGREPILGEEHFGIEIPYFRKQNPDLEAVSISPNIENPHSPNERVSVSSISRMWEYVQAIIRGLNKEHNIEPVQEGR